MPPALHVAIQVFVLLWAFACGGADVSYESADRFPELHGQWTLDQGATASAVLEQSYTLNPDGTGTVHVGSEAFGVDETSAITEWRAARAPTDGFYQVHLDLAGDQGEGRLLVRLEGERSADIAMSTRGEGEWPAVFDSAAIVGTEGWSDAPPEDFVRR